MLPTLRSERSPTFGGDQGDYRLAGAAPNDAADARDWNAADAPRYARGGACGKQEFIVFSAMESLCQRCRGIDGKGGSMHLGGDAGFLAKVREIGGKTIAQINGRSCARMGREPQTLCDARLRIEMRF